MIQIFFNVLFGLGIGLLWVRLNRPAKEDPRLSRGLQLLQTKIAILEDLSDRTDKQVSDLCNLLDKKSKELQEVMLDAEKHNQEVRKSIQKSLEVAEIFEDKIPHEEIIERQNSKKYIEAARLAHQGLSANDIAKQVDLSFAEISMITKVNKDRLMFDEEELPEWAQKNIETHIIGNEQEEGAKISNKFSSVERDYSSAFEAPKVEEEQLKELGKRFREACKGNNTEDISYLENLRKESAQESKIIQDIEEQSHIADISFEELKTGVTTSFNTEKTEDIVKVLSPEELSISRERSKEPVHKNLEERVSVENQNENEVVKRSEDSVEQQIIKEVVFPKVDPSNLIG